jgi:hypothetical protein
MAIFERFSAIQVQKGVKRHNFVPFYTIYSLSLAQKWVSSAPFHQEFPENPYHFATKKFTPPPLAPLPRFMAWT